jgi:hypothetical protein
VLKGFFGFWSLWPFWLLGEEIGEAHNKQNIERVIKTHQRRKKAKRG